MTKGNVKMMLHYKKEIADKHQRQVFEAVWELGRSDVQKIKNYLDKRVKREAKSQYEEGALDRERLPKLIKENMIEKRTIHRKLNELIKLGLVEQIGREYIITDAWIGDLRYFVVEKAQDFGQGLLGRLAQRHYPTNNTLDVNLKELVEIFGFFMLYCMLESCRPVPFKSRYRRPTVPNMFNDKLAIKWVGNVFDPVFILGVFISAINNQIGDKELEETKKNQSLKTLTF